MRRLSSIYRLTVPSGAADRLQAVAAQHVEVTGVNDTSLSFRVRGGDIPALAMARFLVGEDADLSTGYGIHRRTVK